MRVLVLHGFGQSGEVMRRKFANAKLLRDVTLLFPDGPFEVEGGRAWFHFNPHVAGTSGANLLRSDVEWPNIEVSLAQLREIGAVDAIVGFSQGAMLARYVARELACGKVCFVSGCCIAEPAGVVGVDSAVTLHCYGERDDLVTPAQSLELAERYTNAQVFSHAAGHVVPSTAPFRNALREFLG